MPYIPINEFIHIFQFKVEENNQFKERKGDIETYIFFTSTSGARYVAFSLEEHVLLNKVDKQNKEEVSLTNIAFSKVFSPPYFGTGILGFLEVLSLPHPFRSEFLGHYVLPVIPSLKHGMNHDPSTKTFSWCLESPKHGLLELVYSYENKKFLKWSSHTIQCPKEASFSDYRNLIQ